MRKINVTLKKSELTLEIVRELIDYRPSTGEFFWKDRKIKWFLNEMPESIALGYQARWNAAHAGKPIHGTCVKLLGVTYPLTDLAFYFMYGFWSKDYIHEGDSFAWKYFRLS